MVYSLFLGDLAAHVSTGYLDKLIAVNLTVVIGVVVPRIGEHDQHRHEDGDEGGRENDWKTVLMDAVAEYVASPLPLGF